MTKFFEATGVKAEDVDYETVLGFLEQYGGEGGLHTVILSLRLFFKFMYNVSGDEKWAELLEKAKTRRLPAKPPDVLTRDEVMRLLEAIDDLEYRAMAAVIYETGMRLSEARSLRLRDLTFTDRGVKVMVRRSKSQWRVNWVVEFQDLLKRWLEIHPARDESVSWSRGIRSSTRKVGFAS